MANDRDASISDAAFREAVEAMLDAIEAHNDVVCCESDDGSHEWVLFPGTMKDFLRARVLALYAERQGEEYAEIQVSRYEARGGKLSAECRAISNVDFDRLYPPVVEAPAPAGYCLLRWCQLPYGHAGDHWADLKVPHPRDVAATPSPAFAAAVDMLMEMSANYGSVSGPALDAAEARVLALYAERGEALAEQIQLRREEMDLHDAQEAKLYAERQGVECVVAATGRETVGGALTTIRVSPVEGAALPAVQLGDRVMVSRVEEQ